MTQEQLAVVLGRIEKVEVLIEQLASDLQAFVEQIDDTIDRLDNERRADSGDYD